MEKFKVTLRSDIVERLEKLYQLDIAWCLESGCSPHSDLSAYVNYLLFMKIDDEEEFFVRRNLIKDRFSFNNEVKDVIQKK